MKTKLTRRFVAKFGTAPMFGAPYWATFLLFNRWKELDMRNRLNLHKELLQEIKAGK